MVQNCYHPFLNKPYQETNFKSHLNSVLPCKQRKILSNLHMWRLILFNFTYLFSHFAMKLKDANYKSHILYSHKYFSIILPMKNDARSEYITWKCLILFNFHCSWFTLVLKLRNFDFKSQWKTLIFFDKKIYDVRFEYVSWKNVLFCFISIVWVQLSHKT